MTNPLKIVVTPVKNMRGRITGYRATFMDVESACGASKQLAVRICDVRRSPQRRQHEPELG